MQNLHQSPWDHEISLYTDRALKDEQLLIGPFLWKTKNSNVDGSWELKFIFCFTKTTHEPPKDKLSLVYIPMKLLNMAMAQMFSVMLGHTLNHCVEFCNFVQFHILVNYLSFCVPLITLEPSHSNLLQHCYITQRKYGVLSKTYACWSSLQCFILSFIIQDKKQCQMLLRRELWSCKLHRKCTFNLKSA
jgi:hypothetical protein